MSKASQARLKVNKAIAKVGNSLKLRTITQDISTYNPYNPTAGEVIVDVDIKGIVKTEATQRVVDAFENVAKIENSSTSFELSIILSGDLLVTKRNKLVYKGDEYKIVYVSEVTMQDEIINYEVLAKH